MSDTKIDYLTKTWNFMTGCLNHSNGVCPIGSECWAKQMAHRYTRSFEPQLHPEKLLEPLSWKKPQRVGVCFTGDLMGEWVDPGEWVRCDEIGFKVAETEDQLIAKTLSGWIAYNLANCPQHQFFFLTKNPAGYAKWGMWPDNAWIGATVCNQEMLIDTFHELHKVEAKHKWLSIEPLMEALNGGECEGKRLDCLKDAGISWVVIGGWSGGKNPPKLEWIREIVEACDKAGIPVWLKNNLASLLAMGPQIPLWAANKKCGFYCDEEHGHIDHKLRQQLPEAR